MDTQPKRPNRLSLPQDGPLEKSQEFFSCSYPDCDYKSNWEENVGRHELGHNPKGLDCNIPCQVCPQTFLYLVSFLYHMTSKHSNKLFCPFCLFLGEDLAEFKGHMIAHKPATPRHRCETCAKTYKSKDSLYCHQKFYCASKFSTKATTSAEEIQAGNVCNSSVQNSTSSSSQLNHKNVDSFNGAQRPKYNRKDNKRRMEPKKSQLTILDTTVNKDDEVVKRPPANVAFQCSNCSKTFKHKCNVLQHQKKNCRIAQLRCDKCSYRALHAQDLHRHIGIHLAGELLKCQHLGCDYTTLWTETLQKHQDSCKIRIPAPENSDGISNLIENLMKEMKIFEGEFPFSCTFCSFTSISRYSVRKHLQVHVARAPLRCPRKGCNYKTKFSHFLRKHSRRVHPLKARKVSLTKPKITDIVAARSERIPMDDIAQANSQLPQEEIIKQVFVGGKTLFRCEICGYKSKWKHNLKYHLMVHTHQKPFGCPVSRCMYRSKRRQSVSQHARIVHQFDLPRNMKLESNKKLGSCSFVARAPLRCHRKGCNYQTKSSLILRKHYRRVHPCEARKAPFKTIESPSKSNHKNVDSFNGQRPKSTRKDNKRKMEPKKSQLKLTLLDTAKDEEVVKRAPANIAFQCSNCSKTFRHKGNLVRHQKDICPIALLRCDKCSYRALHAQDLRRHIGVHLAGELLKCQHLGCDYTTLWTETLRKHQDSCKIRIPAPKTSDGMSNSIETFIREVKIAEVESQYSCTFCSFKAKSVSNVSKHLMVHVARAPLRCYREGCDYQTKWFSELRKHSRIHHPIELLPKSTQQAHVNLGSDGKSKDKIEGFVSSTATAFACMLCEFVGYSELSALKHSCQHRTVVISLNRI